MEAASLSEHKVQRRPSSCWIKLKLQGVRTNHLFLRSERHFGNASDTESFLRRPYTYPWPATSHILPFLPFDFSSDLRVGDWPFAHHVWNGDALRRGKAKVS